MRGWAAWIGLVVGCSSAAVPSAQATTTTVRMTGAIARAGSAGPPAIELAEGVRPVSLADCVAAEETCNALDDDCDTIVDEDCGLARGALEVTLAWTGAADLDLYVTDPSGATLSTLSPVSPSGGMLDHGGQGDCDRREPLNRLEHAVWLSGRPVAGRYVIEVLHWGTCGGAGDTEATLAVSFGGHALGVYQVTLAPRRERAVARIVVP